jgi:hypothetical protein
MLSCSSSRPALQPAVLSQQGGRLRHRLAKSLIGSHQRSVNLPRSRARYQAVRADSGAANDGLGPLESIANWWRNITGQGTPESESRKISCEQHLLSEDTTYRWSLSCVKGLLYKSSQTAGHAAGPNPDKTAEAVKEKASKAESEVKQHVSSGKQAVSTAADSASETPPPLKVYPKVATNGQVASSNGSKKHQSVSTCTQTEPVKPGKSKESAEAASWSQSGAALHPRNRPDGAHGAATEG